MVLYKMQDTSKIVSRETIPKPIDGIILDNWIKFAQAKIITVDEARRYLHNQFISQNEFKRMFPNAEV